MSLNRLFDVIQQIKEAADVRAAFGEPQVLEDKTIIPVARVSYGMGLGFGSGEAEGEFATVDDSGGGGGGASSAPLGALVVTPDEVRFVPSLDVTKVVLASLATGAWVIYQLARTMQAIFGRN
jgi:uncharacterized spore protein YtfJ